MKKILIAIMVLSLSLSLISCGESVDKSEKVSNVENTQKPVQTEEVIKKDYYPNSAYENLETFTEVTGIELSETEENLNNCKYFYNGADSNSIDEYEKYLADNYGLKLINKSEEYSSSTYGKDDMSPTIYIRKTDENFLVTIPWNEAVAAEKHETIYQQMITDISEKKYSEIEEKYEEISDYKDSQNYINYAIAHTLWDFDNEVGIYKVAIDYLNKSGGILDSAEKAQQLAEKMNALSGTYEFKDTYLTKYITVDNGTAKMSFRDYESTEYYVTRTVLDEAAMKTLGYNATSTEETLKTNVLSHYYEYTRDVEQGYLFMDVEGGSKLAFDISELSLGTFNGVYKKIK